MKRLVISIDNEIGLDRRKKLNYNFIHLKGETEAPKWVRDKFKLYHNEDVNSKKVKGRMACFSSHIKALEYIVNNKINDIVILEDDAFLEGEIIDLPNNSACLLGGTLRHPIKWSMDYKFRKNEVSNIINNFNNGINIIDYDKFRWTQAYSIYYPKWEIAKEILDFIKNTKYMFKHYDIFLANHRLIKYLHYPSIYSHDDRDSISQVNKKNGYIKNYIIQTENNTKTHKQIFTNIYDKNIWGDGSGKGSSIEYNKKYIEYLEKIIKEKNINSILDLGCGDWNFSKIINYDNINYLGIDCVDKVIKSNIENYKKNNINFICDDIYNLDNFFKNEIDLVIIKDVLQHLSDEEIELFLNKLLEKNFKYLLITNAFSKKKIDRNVNTRYRYSKLNVNHYPLNNYFNNENIIDKFNYRYKQVVFISQTENHTKMK